MEPDPGAVSSGTGKPKDDPFAGVTEGRIVHFVMHPGDEVHPREHRAAMIVRDFGGGTVNLIVFVDGQNDRESGFAWSGGTLLPTSWVTSVSFDAEAKSARTWHWIERA